MYSKEFWKVFAVNYLIVSAVSDYISVITAKKKIYRKMAKRQGAKL